MNKEDIKFIPGWMDRAELYNYDGLNIWNEDVKPEDRIDAKYILAHSIGAHFALLNWKKNKNTKLILVNPLLVKRKFRCWAWRWIKFFFFEEPEINAKRAFVWLHLFSNLKKCRKMLQIKVSDILDEIPKEDILIIRGKKDRLFCNEEVAAVIKEKNLPLIELEDNGHLWTEKVDEAIEKYIENY
jgi:hypothetical protein